MVRHHLSLWYVNDNSRMIDHLVSYPSNIDDKKKISIIRNNFSLMISVDKYIEHVTLIIIEQFCRGKYTVI